MLSNVTWLGHATLKFNAGKIVYIDPYQIKGNPEKADFILITHDHYDHFSDIDIKKIQSGNTVIILPKSSQKTISGNILKIDIGQTLNFNDLLIKAVPSYNINKKFHPKNNRNIGYILTTNDIRYYHAGDTDVIPEMKDFNVDVAFLPIGGTYTMTPEEAARATELLNPKIAVPIHYNSIVGSASDAVLFKQLCRCQVTILKQEK